MPREWLVRARRRLVSVILLPVLALYPRTANQSNPDVLSDSVFSLREWGRYGKTLIVRFDLSRPSCFKVGDAVARSLIRPRASGLLEKAGSLNVCQRGESPGW